MDLEQKAAKLSNVRWKLDHASFIADCPNNSDHHKLAVSKASYKCLDGCAKELLDKFFANGNGKKGHVAEPPAERKPNDIYDWQYRLSFVAKNTLTDPKTRTYIENEDREHLRLGLISTFRDAMLLADNTPPPDLSPVEIDEHLDSLAQTCLDQYLPEHLPARNDSPQLPELPDIFAGELEIMSGRQLLERHATSKNQTVIEGFLALKEISIWSGKVEAGKTTLLRTAAMCVARGTPFLDRTAIKGRVLYVMLDADGIDLTTQEFLRLGYDPDRDPIDWLIDPILAMRQDGFSKFYGALLRLQPTLVIIDPFGRFQEIKDFNAYDATYAMARISELAKQANCHIALPHHIPRGRNDDADAGTAGLGSISIGGGTNARFVCTHKPGDIYTIKTSKGKGASFVPLGEEYTLNRDPDSGWVTLGQPYSWKAQAVALKPQVLQIVERSEEPLTANQIGKELGLFKSACGVAANMLWEDGLIDREGKGKKGSKFYYLSKKKEPQKGSQYQFDS